MTDFVERRWTSQDGLSLYARDYAGAAGPARLPVVCLHGLTRNSKDFEDLAPLIAAGSRRVIVPDVRGRGLLATGGGAHNLFLIERLQAALQPAGVQVVVPDKNLIDFKEALVMALIGILRWREEYNVLASVTGASRSSIGGAVWIGQEA